MIDTNDEWITTRTGVKQRHVLKGKGKGTSDMGAEAVKELLKKTNTDPSEIDMLVCGTITPDFTFPSTANLICDKIGALNAFSYDINAACSGFVYGLVTGSKFIESGTHKKVVVVGGDKMSSIINYEDRTTCVIFGDGAAAVMLEPNTEGYGIQDSILKADGAGWKHLHQKAGGSNNTPSHKTVDAMEHFVYQEGQAVFKHAVKNMADVTEKIMAQNNLSPDDVAWLVPHQANTRIINATADRVGLPPEKVMLNIQKYGNTTGGTIPLCLWDYEKQLKKGDNIIISTFGGGFTWGAVYLKWGYNSK